MRRWVILVMLAATACASSPAQQCLNISGHWVVAKHQPVVEGAVHTIAFSDDYVTDRLTSLVVEQIGCTVKLHVTDEGQSARDFVFDHDVTWDEEGMTFSWSPASHGSSILPGTSRRTRSLSLKLSAAADQLTVVSGVDERGVALLFMPFHNHTEAVRVMTRTP